MTVNQSLTQLLLLTLVVEIAAIGALQNQQNGTNQNLNLIQTPNQVQDRTLIAKTMAIGAHRNQQNGMSQRRRKLQSRQNIQPRSRPNGRHPKSGRRQSQRIGR